MGTVAHAFILSRAQARSLRQPGGRLGVAPCLLVDTYDIEQGIRTAVEVARSGLGAIRIDSGDLDIESRRARALLDELSATGTRIVVTQ